MQCGTSNLGNFNDYNVFYLLLTERTAHIWCRYMVLVNVLITLISCTALVYSLIPVAYFLSLERDQKVVIQRSRERSEKVE